MFLPMSHKSAWGYAFCNLTQPHMTLNYIYDNLKGAKIVTGWRTFGPNISVDKKNKIVSCLKADICWIACGKHVKLQAIHGFNKSMLKLGVTSCVTSYKER